MADEALSKVRCKSHRGQVVPAKEVFGRTAANRLQLVGGWLLSRLDMAGWQELLGFLLLIAVMVSTAFADSTRDRTLLPIEVLGESGTTVTRSVVLEAGLAESVRSLWLEVNGLRYAGQASVQINASAWVPLDNNTVAVAEPGKSFGGIGGGFATLRMSFPLPKGTVLAGSNTIRFRFNWTDGISSGYRILAWNFLTDAGGKVLAPGLFVEDTPETWTPPLPDAASIRAGRELWHTASLIASSLPSSPRIQAHCADCHAQDGRDLKYFNFSNHSIVTRSRFHGLSTLEGEQIASYIRSLPLPNPGRPWNPPYQPGPGLDAQPVSNWSAGAGLSWVLDQDTDGLPYLLSQHGAGMGKATANPPGVARHLAELARQVDPAIFRPDGNLNPRQIPIALQLPDWSQWLPHIHPKDAWGGVFTESEFAAAYGGETIPANKMRKGAKPALRTLLATAQARDSNIRPVVAAFAQWSEARRAFLRPLIKTKAGWSPALTDKVYSTQLWQLVKTWEMMQEFGLEDRGRDLIGLSAESRTWCNFIAADTAPSAAHIRDGAGGVGGSALTNEYFTAAWYELQIILNSGNHQHRERAPIDWIYLIGRFIDLYQQTHQPEPTRLLVAVTKALQSTDPHLGPDNLSQGWRPEQNVDPRIMISPVWAPMFKPLPVKLRQALTASLLAAWMEKNLQYPIAKYLPLGVFRQGYSPSHSYGDISGGKVWMAAPQFRNAGVPPELVQLLQQWGMAFSDRAARLQYDRYGLGSKRQDFRRKSKMA